MYLLRTASEYSRGKKGKEKLTKESQKKYSGISAILRYIYLNVYFTISIQRGGIKAIVLVWY